MSSSDSSFSSSFSSAFVSSAAAAPPAAAPPAAGAPPAPPDGTEASLLEPSEISYGRSQFTISFALMMLVSTHLVDVLALELGEELLQTLVISLNANGLEDVLDVLRTWAGVATEAEKEVCCEAVACQVCLRVSRIAVRSYCFIFGVGSETDVSKDSR